MAPVKPVPVMVTVVPPAVGPEVGEMAVTAGRHQVGELVGAHRRTGPDGRGHVDVVLPAAWAGETAVIWVSRPR